MSNLAKHENWMRFAFKEAERAYQNNEVPIGSIIIQRVTLAIGAGIYEEFLFRVLLILML